MKNHDDYNVMIQLLVDNELTGEERSDLVSHVEQCTDCQRDLNEAKALSVRVRESRPRVVAPSALREKILRQMSNPEVQSTKYPLAHKESTIRTYWRPLALVAMLCIAVGGVFSFYHFQQESRAESFVDAAVAEHRAFDDARPLDVRSSSSQVVTAWFAQRVSFPFRMPNAGIAADDRANYTLVGGRLVKFAGEPAALLEFRIPDNRISLLIVSNRLAAATGGKVTLEDGLRFHTKDLDDLHVATWNNQGLTYALISSVAMRNKSSCSNCHRDSPDTTAALSRSKATFWHAQPLPEASENQVSISHTDIASLSVQRDNVMSASPVGAR